MSPLDLRAASGQAADDQDPETNGMAENEDRRLEMDNLLKHLGETLRDLEAEMEWEQQQLTDSQVGLHGRRGWMLNESSFSRDTRALVSAAADEDGDGMLSVDEVVGDVDDREPKKAMRKEFWDGRCGWRWHDQQCRGDVCQNCREAGWLWEDEPHEEVLGNACRNCRGEWRLQHQSQNCWAVDTSPNPGMCSLALGWVRWPHEGKGKRHL